MSLLQRRIVLIDFLRTGEVQEHSIEFSGVEFRISVHRIGWDFDTAAVILESQDGFADGFAISGIQKRATAGKKKIPHPGYLKLLRLVQKTPIYLADDLRDLFTEWSLQKIVQSEPHLLAGRKLLFQCAAVTPAIDRFEQAGVRIQAADALIFGGIPKLLEGRDELERFFKIAHPIQKLKSIESLRPEEKLLSSSRLKALLRWLEASDGLVTFGSLLDRVMSPELLQALESKVLIVDYLTPETRALIQSSKVGQVLELVPDLPGLESLPIRHFSIITAVLDQCRQIGGSKLPFDEYVLRAIQAKEVKPSRFSRSHRKLPVRCAFVIHPLTEKDIFRHPALGWIDRTPDLIRSVALDGIARVPGFHYGTIRGAVSQHNGQEVICDLYTLTTTPRQILSMPEERLYDQLHAITKLAHKRGASLLGLGAYTKVVGDAGVTVARYSPIPVTNGNSYSASTTLWAARTMSERMGFVSLDPSQRGIRPKQKAMIIGATGSIGRVSALLVSRVTDELILVAQRADKLLELREEVLRLSPEITVKITTQADEELADTDLIVTATSNTQGQILDILKVKPGAVICDCSRPLDVTAEMSALRPDVLVIQSGEVELPGEVKIDCDIGLPKPSVYACLAETMVLAMEGRFENFSLSKTLSMEKVKEIYQLGIKHGARLSAIQTHHGVVTDAMMDRCRELALARLALNSPKPSTQLTGLESGVSLRQMQVGQIKRFFVGEPLTNQMASHERIPKWKALAVMASDALSSTAYATEEILLPLAALSVLAMSWSMPIALGITMLLVIVSLSYLQTIEAYPGGGGAYTVAKENLGTGAGLVAGAALLLDYVLTVSVSVAAGMANFDSAFPFLQSHRVAFSAFVIFIIMVLNLRGIRESATVFAFPTYFFIISFFSMLGVGAWKVVTGQAVAAAPIFHETYPELSLFLILRAFSSGCAALSGIEAISNGVTSFRAPEARNAKITLIWMALILAVLFMGTTLLAHVYGVSPREGETVISQLARGVFGDTVYYYVLQFATALILFLAANTAYTGFPSLASMLAKDRFLPRQLASLGDRLVFSNGILGLSFFAFLLIWFFDGDVHKLIPLYAIGVFLSFTLSQSGMVIHHLKLRKPGWVSGIAINSVGAVTTLIVLGVVATTKFTHGAWMVILIMPFIVYTLTRIHAHYLAVGKELSLLAATPPGSLSKLKHTVVVPISGIHRGVIDALRYAVSISDDVRACYVEIDPETTERVKDEWMKWAHEVPFVVLKSPYRSVIRPLLEYIDDVAQCTHDDMVTVIIPEFVTSKWRYNLLHNQTALLIRTALLFKRGKVVTSVRYHLKN